MCKKVNILVTSILSFSHNVFYQSKTEIIILATMNCRLQLLSNDTRPRFCRLWQSWLFITQSRLLTTLKEKGCENIVRNGENACNQHFLLFPNVFYPSQIKFQILIHISFVVCKYFP